MDGAVLVDKPVGVTSNFALQQVKRLFGAKKAGHAGTLDPLASGLLVVLFGEATKFAAFLLDEDKEYVATLKLGERTSTGDAEGSVLEAKPVRDDLAQALPAALEQFRGEIQQVPPMHSALKRGGVPLYVLARRGEAIERRPRKVRILGIEVRRIEKPMVEIRVRCSKGTYVRTLAEDIGAALGTVAHLAALRRTASGRFSVAEASTPESLAGLPADTRAGRLLPLESLLAALPRADLDFEAAARFRNGQTVLHGVAGPVCGVYGPDGKVIGLGRGAEGQLRPLRLTASASG